jgi:hypothetical protein
MLYKKLLADKSTFFCFTPLASLVTFIVEFALAFYIFFRYKMGQFNKIVVFLLLLLGLFQLSEYTVCKTNDLMIWGKIGAASITLLPILGLHLVTYLTKPTKWLSIGYIWGVIMLLAILFVPSLTIDTRCTGKFVNLSTNASTSVYTLYYFGFLMIGISKLIQFLREHKGDRQELLWMIFAYASFIVPTALVYSLFALAVTGIPSVMCGFAIIFAVIIAFKEVPRFNKLYTKKKS